MTFDIMSSSLSISGRYVHNLLINTPKEFSSCRITTAYQFTIVMNCHAPCYKLSI